MVSKPKAVPGKALAPAGGRRERKRQMTADHLARTAFELFESHGYENVTMEQIAATADVAKATLYQYFPVKEALLAHHFQQEIAAGMEEMWPVLERQPTFAARMQHLLHASAEWNKERRAYLPHYVRFQMITADYGLKEPDPRHRPSGAHQISAHCAIIRMPWASYRSPEMALASNSRSSSSSTD